MNLILKWLSSFFLEKIFKTAVEAMTNYFNEREKKRLAKLEEERKNKLASDNKKKLDAAILKGNLDEIKNAANDYINAVDNDTASLSNKHTKLSDH